MNETIQKPTVENNSRGQYIDIELPADVYARVKNLAETAKISPSEMVSLLISQAAANRGITGLTV